MYTVTMQDVLRIPTNEMRQWALRQCVADNEDLVAKFDSYFGGGDLESTSDEIIIASLNDFIDVIGLHVVNETPSVRVNENNWYVIDVTYDIEIGNEDS
jgi:hypothetical protein